LLNLTLTEREQEVLSSQRAHFSVQSLYMNPKAIFVTKEMCEQERRSLGSKVKNVINVSPFESVLILA